MPVTLSIKRVPDKLVARLKRRAAAHHRSLQGELLSLLEQAVATPITAERAKMSVAEVMREIKRIGLRTPDESVQMVREDRDRGHHISSMDECGFGEVCDALDKLGLHTESDSVRIIREMRDGRQSD